MGPRNIAFPNELLRRIGAVADEQKIDAYVVGGYVRDILMGRPEKDIDVVVVGDGVAFARVVAGRLGQDTVVTFDRFGTAMIPFHDGKVEFVGARREAYQRDSRNPAVSVGTLRDDLLRRDFTVNAIAASLNAGRFGEIVDPLNGEDDIGEKLLTLVADAASDDDRPGGDVLGLEDAGYARGGDHTNAVVGAHAQACAAHRRRKRPAGQVCVAEADDGRAPETQPVRGRPDVGQGRVLHALSLEARPARMDVAMIKIDTPQRMCRWIA